MDQQVVKLKDGNGFDRALAMPGSEKALSGFIPVCHKPSVRYRV